MLANNVRFSLESKEQAGVGIYLLSLFVVIHSLGVSGFAPPTLTLVDFLFSFMLVMILFPSLIISEYILPFRSSYSLALPTPFSTEGSYALPWMAKVLLFSFVLTSDFRSYSSLIFISPIPTLFPKASNSLLVLNVSVISLENSLRVLF